MATTLRNPAKWLFDFFGGNNQVRVNEKNLLASPAIWYAITTISGDVAKMPIEVRRKDAEGGHELYKKHPAYKLLTQEPNHWQTADVFKEMITGHALGWGNGRAAIVRQGSRPVELIPLMPDRTETVLVRGEKYHVTMPEEDDPVMFSNLITERNIKDLIEFRDVIVLHDSEVLHIGGFGYDGVKGLSVARVLQDAIGIDLQSQKYANNGMRKGFAGEIMLEAPPGLFRDQDDAEAFLKHFRKQHERGQEGETVGLLREGIKANVMNMSPADSQFIEQRTFSRQDIMLIFGLQHIPGDDTATSYNSLEQKQLAYLASCLDRWLVRWESQSEMKLRTEPEKRSGNIYFKFDRATWVRTDTMTKQEFLSGLLASTVINRNEARSYLDLNPVEGGDEFLNPFTTSDSNEPENTNSNLDDSENLPGNENSDAVENRLRYLTKVESKSICNLSDRKDFLDELENFYTKWAITLLNNNIPVEKVEQTVESHKNGILERAERTTSLDEFRKSIKLFAKQWCD